MNWHPDIPEEFRNKIITGDARILAEQIPDKSIDLIFTDPIYDRADDYKWLAETSARILKPSGMCLVWSNGKWHYHNTRWLEENGLTWRYDFGCVIDTGPAPMCGKIIAKTNRLIWLDVSGESSMIGYLADGYRSATKSRFYDHWSWTKNPIFSQQAIEAFVGSGQVVFDPYLGEGTTSIICSRIGLDWI